MPMVTLPSLELQMKWRAFSKKPSNQYSAKKQVEPSKLDQIQKLGTPEFILEDNQLDLHKKNELEFQKSNEIENHLDQKTIIGESLKKLILRKGATNNSQLTFREQY